MSSTTFTDGVTLSAAAWFNDVDSVAYSVLSGVAGTNTVTATGPKNYSYAATKPPIWFIPAATNTGAATINVTPSGSSALGAKNIFQDGAACIGGEMKIGVLVGLTYDGTQFNIIGERSRGPVLLSSATAAASATIDFSSNITSTFDEYLIDITNLIPVTDNTDLWLRISEDSGVSFKAGAGNYHHERIGAGAGDATTTQTGVSGDTKIIIANALNNAQFLSGQIRIFGPAGTSAPKLITWHICFRLTGTSQTFFFNGGASYIADSNAINGLRLMMSSGNISVGNFALYGMRKA